jgi:hypothetical protein
MVQIARYFGSEYLRPELENGARTAGQSGEPAPARCQQQVTVHVAATLLRDHTLLSRSKAGSDMLKALIVMPQNTHFRHERAGRFCRPPCATVGALVTGQLCRVPIRA